MLKTIGKGGFITQEIKAKSLKPTKQRFFKKKIFGFDIETYDDNKEFLLASVYSEDFQKFYYSKSELIHDLKKNRIFRDSYIFATNLSFDFFGTFFNYPNFFTLFRGSDLLTARTYIYHEDFIKQTEMKGNALRSITFLDTMNYSKISVETMGKIIGIPKLQKPSFLGKKPKDDNEWSIMHSYNMQDSRISYEFMRFMISSIESLGGTFKDTIGSTAIRLFSDKYLNDIYYINNIEQIEDQFKSYYGGRTEAFRRGYIENYYYYDFNSLYPSVMRDNVFPDPNTVRTNYKGSYKYIEDFEGVSDVDMTCPIDMNIPLIPVRTETGKVIFPTGEISGFYTHIEIREALKHGYILNKIRKTVYFTDTCSPFKRYVEELYNLRNIYKKDKNPMEIVVKLLLNSLYGKFAQKYLNRDNWIHDSMLDDDIILNEFIAERKGEYCRVVKDSEPSNFCFPIWASYITAYGRIKLYREIIKHKPAYVDTDSLLIDHEIEQSTELGKLKLEMKIKKGCIVRPKFYALMDADSKEYVKIKGLGTHLTYLNFFGLLKDKRVNYHKFSKFKESVRRGFIPNQIIPTHKTFGVEDEKRRWDVMFNPDVEQDSKPLYYNYKTEELKQKAKIDDKIRKQTKKNMKEFTESDLFDSSSVGHDITSQDFIKNEIWFEKEGL